MTKKQDKPSKEVLAHIDRLIRLFRSRLFLDDWHFESSYPVQVDIRRPDVSAEINADAVYLQAHITFGAYIWRDLWRERNYQKLAGVICHELCYCLTGALADMAMKSTVPDWVNETQERLTQRIANVCMTGMDEKDWLPRGKK